MKKLYNLLKLLPFCLFLLSFGNIQSQTVLINPTGGGGFELGNDFASNGWTLVNYAAATNSNWYITSSALTSGSYSFTPSGTNAAFISNDGGTTWRYNTSPVTSTVHFYRDVTFPSGETKINLSFRWTDNGESYYDEMYVYLCPTTLTPVTGSPNDYTYKPAWTGTGTANLVGIFTQQNAGSGINAALTIPQSFIGNTSSPSTMRLVFTWKNNASAGAEPPAAIDDISLTSAVPVPLSGIYTIDNTLPTSGTNFASFHEAFYAVNSNGVSGATTFRVTAGQTFSESPLFLTVVGTADNTISFVKYGAGSNPVISSTGTGSQYESVVQLNGSDYVTLDGIDLTDAGIDASSYVDYGFYLNGYANDGCQNNTFKNGVINLHKENITSLIYSTGIYTYSMATSSAAANKNNKFLNTTVQNCYIGYYFYGASVAPDDGNEINNQDGGTSLITNIGGGSSGFYGIYFQNQTGFIIKNTTFSNITSSNSMNAIYNAGGTVTADISGNTFTALTSTHTGIPFTVVYLGSAATMNFYSNNFNNIIGAAAVNAVSTAGGTFFNIYKNNIHNIVSGGSFTLSGIYIGGGNVVNIFNNLIYDLQAPASTQFQVGAAGIYLFAGTTLNVYNNTVYLDYTSTTPENRSSALFATTTPSSIDLRNNIFVNNCNMTIGTMASAFTRSAAGFTNIVATTNNNLYYAGTPGAKNVIFYDGANSDQTLAAYKNRIRMMDQNSVTENPPFVSSSDLHINPLTPTQVESGGAPVSIVTTDYDGDSRDAIHPDLGADEGTFTFIDLSGPAIQYTALGNISSASNRTFSGVAITDVSGVNTTSGTAPRVYYKRSTDANTFNDNTSSTDGWKWVEASGTTSPFSFTIDYSKLNGGTGVSSGNTVQYFIAAQDQVGTPNVNVNSGLFAAAPSSVDLTAAAFPIAGTINSYSISLTYSGTYTVGNNAAYNFQTLKGAFDALTPGVLSGDVTLSIQTEGTTETATAVLGALSYEGGGPYTVTIKPAAGTTPVITGALSTGIVKLNGADNVVIDGSNTVGGITRDLSITNTYTAASAAIWLSSLGAGSGASNNVIRNCNLSCNAPQNTGAVITFGIFSGGSTIGITSVGPDNDNNTFSNNYITKVRYGIFSAGGNSANPNSGTVITGNLIGPDSFGVTEIGKAGIVLYNETGAAISQNEIRFVGGDFVNTPTAGNDRVGIALAMDAVWPTSTIAYVTNTTVSRNLIHHIVNERTFSAAGIIQAAGFGTSNTGNVISNNMMYNIKANGTSNHQALGIGVSIGRGDIIAFNSVYLTGDTDPYATAGTPTVGSFCFSIGGSSAVNLSIENNIFVMDLTSSSAPLLKNACVNIPAVYNWGTGLTNFNDMYVIPGHTQSYVGCRGGGGTAGIFYADLAAWRTISSQDANSISIDPQFISATDLHINTLFNDVGDKGFPLVGITTDLDGDLRSAGTPDIGADEYTYSGITTFQHSVDVVASWNMVSVPGLHPVNQQVDTWWQYRNPLADMYKWNGAYIAVQNLSPGEGYWMLHSGARTYNTGDEWPAGGIQVVAHDPIPIISGWNMIGAYDLNSPVAQLTTTPPGLIVSGTVYGWNGSYYAPTNLVPGYGYWILTTGSGVINVGAKEVNGTLTKEDNKENWGKINITDASGKSFTLYSVNGEVNLDRYQLPPLPPAGCFDVRFSTQRKAENLKSARTIDLSGVKYPLTLTAEKTGLKVQDETGKLLNKRIKAGESITISSGINKLIVGESLVPDVYSLAQNYPNPFNPVTSIQFTLPEDVKNITLIVYDALGQKVAQLINGSMEAGYHQYQWNAANSASGLYIYQLRTDKFVSTKKMMLLK